jgi:hypothetical protein
VLGTRGAWLSGDFFFCIRRPLVCGLGNGAGFVSEGYLNTYSPLGWCRVVGLWEVVCVVFVFVFVCSGLFGGTCDGLNGG